MNTTRAMLMMTALFVAMANSNTIAQPADDSDQAQQLQQEHEDLKTEMAALKQEMATLRNEVGALRSELARTAAAVKAAAQRPAQRQRPAQALVGQKAPEKILTTVDDKKITIGGKRDKPQVLFCYASWCGYCKKSLPWMETLHQEYKDKGVEVVALNLDARGESRRARTEEQTLKHFQDLNLTLPMTMTTETNDTKSLGAKLKAQSFPTLFVLGPTGEVESVHIGAKQGLEKTVGAELDLLLAGKTRADFAK